MSKRVPWKKIEGLLARSSSSNVEEARTSAFLACKLIREHDLTIARKEDVDSRHNVRQAATPDSPFPNSTDPSGYWSDVARAARSAGDWEDVAPPWDRAKRDVRIQKARFNSRCYHCKKPINIGEDVAYYPRARRTYHATGTNSCATHAASSNSA